MIEPTPHAPLLLKTAAVVARWALGLTAFAWIVVAVVWGGLHFLIVPRIAEFRPLLESRASSALGLSVRIGAIAAQSNGVIPSLELRDVSLLDSHSREVLRLPKVLVGLSARSALNRGVEQLYIEGPTLDVRRAADGQIWVAGFSISAASQSDGAAADWFFGQPEVAIVGGTVHWTDELRAAPPLTLTAVNFVARNRLLTHALRLDATPPPDWGGRLSASAIFKQPLLSRHDGDWSQWTGQVYADLPHIDVAPLRRYVDLGVDVAQGRGAVRAWVDMDKARITGATADLALTGVNARFDSKLDALAFDKVAGRVGGRWIDDGVEVFTEGLQFDTQDGLHWPGGNVRLSRYTAQERTPEHGSLTADRLDLAALAQIASRLPLDDAAHAALKQLGPQGVVEKLKASWGGPLQSPTDYALTGRVSKLHIAAASHKGAQLPGFEGADIDFDIHPAGGKASVLVRDGSIDARGVFDDPVIPFEQLHAEVQWKVQGTNITVDVPKLRFSNADAQGELQAKWQTRSNSELGHLDLQASLARVQGARVYRYLPSGLDKQVRDYLQESVVGGLASAVKFKVKGDLQDFPFSDPKTGDLRIAANLQNATFAYAPGWPALTQVSGELLIDRGVLQVKGARAGLAGSSGLQISKVDALISDLYGNAALTVTAQAQGPLADGLNVVNTSPLGELTNQVLARASASGAAQYRLKLGFPLAAVERATVQGSITLSGNDIQISPDTPRLTKTRGQVAFTETGFSVTGGQARALGGDVKIDGGISVEPGNVPNVLRLQGTATAEGLRQAKELGFAARIGDYGRGACAYTAALGLRGGVMELQINTNLTGMALNLPAPFGKAAEAPLPLRLAITALRSSQKPGVSPPAFSQDQLQVDIGRLANVAYIRDVTGVDPKVLRGSIGVGLGADESAPMPAQGVVANIKMGSVDLDAWSQVLSKTSGTELSTDMGYLPTSMAVRADELLMDGRTLKRVVVGGGREDLLWRANVDASELSGYVEYRQPSGSNAGRLYGRLARLAIGQSTAQDMETLLDQQPASIPALDVVVEDFELRGKHFGRVEIDAVNLVTGTARDATREWRLNRFNIIAPEATLTASGNWTAINAMKAPAASRSIKDRRRTVLGFKLDIADAGQLLDRFGMTGLVRKGRGKIEGQVSWLGSPITLDYPSLGGNVNVNVEVGQFLKADPGLAKLLGVLSLQALPRRLTLDFRDVFSEGFSFDFFRGDVLVEQGIARTSNLQMKGVNAAVLMDGLADIAKETQALRVVVIPEINAGSASLIASALNPVVGLTTFLAQLILRKPLMDAATQEFFVDGTWVEPRVTKVDRSASK